MWAEWDGAAGPIGSSQSNGFHRVGCGRGPAPHHGAGMITSVSMANVTTQPTSPEISIDRVRMTFARPDECAHLGGASPIAAQQLDAIDAASRGPVGPPHPSSQREPQGAPVSPPSPGRIIEPVLRDNPRPDSLHRAVGPGAMPVAVPLAGLESEVREIRRWFARQRSRELIPAARVSAWIVSSSWASSSPPGGSSQAGSARRRSAIPR